MPWPPSATGGRGRRRPRTGLGRCLRSAPAVTAIQSDLPDVYEDVRALARVREDAAGIGVVGNEVGRRREERNDGAVAVDRRIGARTVRLCAGAVDAHPDRGARLPVVDEDVRALTRDQEAVDRPERARVRVVRDEVRRDRVERDEAAVAADLRTERRAAADPRPDALVVPLIAGAVDADPFGRSGDLVVDEGIATVVRIAGDEVH